MRNGLKCALMTAAILMGCWVAAASQQAGRPPRMAPQTPNVGNTLVRRLDFTRFKANIQKLASFGTRCYDTKGNVDARNWLQAELESFGYKVERHKFTVSGTEVDSLYATKIGTRYPDKMSMQQTDSAPFSAYTAAISLRENRRGSEIGMGSNPNHHRSTDTYENYRDEDFRLGFNALQMTVGAISELIAASGPPTR